MRASGDAEREGSFTLSPRLFPVKKHFCQSANMVVRIGSKANWISVSEIRILNGNTCGVAADL
jgi:hypothetical protein